MWDIILNWPRSEEEKAIIIFADCVDIVDALLDHTIPDFLSKVSSLIIWGFRVYCIGLFPLLSEWVHRKSESKYDRVARCGNGSHNGKIKGQYKSMLKKNLARMLLIPLEYLTVSSILFCVWYISLTTFFSCLLSDQIHGPGFSPKKINI